MKITSISSFVPHNQKINALKNTPISFGSLDRAAKKALQSLPEIEVVQGTSDDFVQQIIKKVGEFPAKWLKKFKEDGSKIVLAPTLTEANTHKGIIDMQQLAAEVMNKGNVHSSRYANTTTGKKFFSFCDKSPKASQFIDGIVNHELSHGIDDTLGLSKSKEVISALSQDFSLLNSQKKLASVSPSENYLLMNTLFAKGKPTPVDEIVAEVIASQQKGGGLYGSGYFFDVDNPNLIPDLFPTLSDKIRKIVL